MDGEEAVEEKMEALLRWAAEIGVSDSSSPTRPSHSSSCLGHSLFVSRFPDAGGRGLAAARDLRKRELVLRVPKSALMTRESVLRDEKLASCVKRHTRLSSTQILTSCLLAEVGKGKGSWWYPYLVQLPRNYDILAGFTQFEIQALQVEHAIWASQKAVLKARSDWNEGVTLMQEMELKPQLQTFRSWLWASATISSRTLHIPWDDAGCLCPVGDLFNYAAPEEEFCSRDVESMAEASHSQIGSLLKYQYTADELDAEQLDGLSQRLTDGGYEEESTSYCFYAKKRYIKGEQVLLSYGTYTNLELLEHYGFLLNVNPNDKAFIQLDTDIQPSNSWPRESLYIQQDGIPSFALLCALRLWATPVNLRRAVGHQAYSGSLLSAENELFVMKWVAKNCHDILGKLPTTIGDDGILLVIIDKLLVHLSCTDCMEILSCAGELNSFFQANGLHKGGLADSPLPMKAKKSLERWKLAVQWRFSYKKILLNCISYCDKMIDRLSSQHVSGKGNRLELDVM